MILASPALSDGATLTGSARAGAPVAYLQRQQPGEVWASPDLVSTDVRVDLGASREWNLVAMLFNNATGDGLWRVRADDVVGNVSGASAAYDSGQAWRFSGAGQYASLAGLAQSATGTLEALVRPRGTTSIASLFQITDGTRLVSVDQANDEIFLSATGAASAIYSPATLYPNEWIHLAAVWGGGALAFYVDRVLVGTVAFSSAWSGTLTLRAGGNALLTSACDVTELRYWTVSRTAGQIAQNAIGPVLPPTTGLAAHFTTAGNATNAGTAGGSATLTGSPTYVFRERAWCSPNLDGFDRRHALLWLPRSGSTSTSRTLRYLRIDFADSGNPDGFIQAGRLIVAKAYQPAVNFGYPAELPAIVDPSAREILPGGQTIVSPFGIRPYAGVTLTAQSEAELYGDLFTIQRTRGASGDVLFVADPDPGPYRFAKTVYGLMQARQGTVNQRFGIYQNRIEIDGLE